MIRLLRTALIGGGIVLATVVVLLVALPSRGAPDPTAPPDGSLAPSRSEVEAPSEAAYDSGTLVGPYYDTEVTSGPTRSKSQSKVWFHDDRWWAVMLASDDAEFRIFAFEPESATWVDTGVVVDGRQQARSDVLWDGEKLIVLSAGGSAEATGDAAEITRFSYVRESASWALDGDFPVRLTETGVGPTTIARDASGVLWMTYVVANQVMVATTNGDDHDWNEPMPLPADNTSVAADEAAVVSTADGIAVMWSNQSEEAIYYAEHASGDPSDVWSPTETAIQGLGVADNHVSLRAIDTPEGTYAVAVTKTSKDEVGEGQQAPLMLVLVRSPDGAWTSSMAGRITDRHTRPALAVEDGHRLHVFATSPFEGGEIVHKVAEIEDLVFEPGVGEAFLSIGSLSSISNVSVPKQNLSAETGMMVIAADDRAGHYVSRAISLGSRPFPRPAVDISTSGERTVVNDRFDGWRDSDAARFGWFVRGGTAQIETSGATSSLRLTGGSDGARICKLFPARAGSAIAATAVVSIDSFGTARSSVMKVRGGGSELLSVRVQSDGQIDYTSGASIRQGPVTTTGVPLRVSVVVGPEATSYQLTIQHALTGQVLVQEAQVALVPVEAPVDEICFEASPNTTVGGIVIDAVIVARVE